jgi:hypothetical protein
MSFEEMIVALVGAIGAFALIGYLSAKVFGLINAWINRNNNSISEESFNRLAKAFMEHKEKTEHRLQNLEAIIASEETSNSRSNSESKSKKIESPGETIEIEDRETHKESGASDNSNLRNMLRE